MTTTYGRFGSDTTAIVDGTVNPAKWSYLGSVLLLTFGLLVDPLAGLIAMIASHAIECTIVAMCTLRSRYGKQPKHTSLLSTLAGITTRRWILFTAFPAGFWLLDSGMRDTFSRQAYLIALTPWESQEIYLNVRHSTLPTMLYGHRHRRVSYSTNVGAGRSGAAPTTLGYELVRTSVDAPIRHTVDSGWDNAPR